MLMKRKTTQKINKSTKTGHSVKGKGSTGKKINLLRVVQEPTGGWAVRKGNQPRSTETFSSKKKAYNAARVMWAQAIQRQHSYGGKPTALSETPKSGFGCARGLITLLDDFEESLNDFSEYT